VRSIGKFNPRAILQEDAENAEALTDKGRLTVSAMQDKAGDSVYELGGAEVHQQSNWHIEQLHIAQKLCLVEREDILHCFDFNQHAPFNQQVRPEQLFLEEAFVVHTDGFLAHRIQFPQLEFSKQTPFVNRLHQTGSFFTMHLDRAANNGICQSGGAMEIWMHGPLCDLCDLL
jgi:hypothetical protein